MAISDEEVLEAHLTNPRGLKPLKVRLPLGHVLRLHRMRIVGDRSVSQIVEAALEDYLKGLQGTKAPQRKSTEP